MTERKRSTRSGDAVGERFYRRIGFVELLTPATR
jgi:hypothetical protein